MDATDLRKIRMEDVPLDQRDIAEELGMDSYLKLIRLCGGQSLYVPKLESLQRDGRDREIRARFNGSNYRALAIQFKLSERQVRKIINGART